MFMIPEVYQHGKKIDPNHTPSAEAVAAMMKYNEDLAKSGVLLSLDGLHPTAKGARVSFSGAKPSVTDGPFIESKEVVGGYWMIDVKSKEEAIEWARKVPAEKGDMIEVRQVFEVSEFPPEVRKAAKNPIVEKAIKDRYHK